MKITGIKQPELSKCGSAGGKDNLKLVNQTCLAKNINN